MNKIIIRNTIKTLFFSVIGLVLLFLFATSAMALIIGGPTSRPIKESHLPYSDWFTGTLEQLADLPTRIGWWEGPPFGGGLCCFVYKCSDTEQFNEALQIFASLNATELELVIYDGPKYYPIIDNNRGDWTFTIWNPERWKRLHYDEKLAEIFEPHYGSTLPAPRIDVYIGGGAIIWEKIKVPENLCITDKRRNPATKEIPLVKKQTPEEPSLPEEISDFYKKWNFVSCVSNPKERTTLLTYIDRQELPPGELLANERLKKVYSLIIELGNYELPGIDPNFIKPEGSQNSKRNYDMVFEIYGTKKINEKITVTVVTRPAEKMKLFSAECDKDSSIEGPRFEKKSNSFNGMISPRLSKKEIHIWRLVDEKWTREEISYQFP